MSNILYIYGCRLLLIWASLRDHLVKNSSGMQKTPVWFPDWEDPWEKAWAIPPVFLDVPCGSAGKESMCNVGDLGSIPGFRRSPGEEKALQYFGLENSKDCIVKVTQLCPTHCDCIVHGIAKSPTWLSEFHFHLLLINDTKHQN